MQWWQVQRAPTDKHHLRDQRRSASSLLKQLRPAPATVTGRQNFKLGARIVRRDGGATHTRRPPARMRRGATAHCWGRNGSPDRSATVRRTTTVLPPGAGLSRVTAISTSHGTTCAIADKTAQCWAEMRQVSSGHGSTGERVPRSSKVAGLADVSAIDVGYNAVCAIDGSTAYCWEV